jgi:SNF2 family DNA or RNA helicase
MENSKILDNVNVRVIDELKSDLSVNSKLKIVAASFSIYAFQALKNELSEIDELKFIFNSDVFTKEKPPKTAREFYIPRLNTERSLYGEEFEIKLRNELSQKAIAKECADWIREKVKFRSNTSKMQMSPFITIENGENIQNYSNMNDFSAASLGIDGGDRAYSQVIKLSQTRHFIDDFNSVWNSDNLEDVTNEVIERITSAYKENSPEFIYFVALYNIFSEFLEDINGDNLPNESTGFKESKVWNLLYDFQRDAVLGCIAKLEKHNGCILADSVGLGKTFSALGVIKYYEARNKSVLVLCPKRLSENWNTYRGNYKNNILYEDRFNYDVLFHTDLGREHGMSNGMDLNRLNWENYDLVVIDESHNFRNGDRTPGSKADDERENRYMKLMNKVMRAGVKTKVLMLSATPVNTKFADLKNQLMLAAEGDSSALDSTLDSNKSLTRIFREADAAFREWIQLPEEKRTVDALLTSLDNDFFILLDNVTIARSRRHIEKFYKNTNVGKFPTRLKPKSLRPDLTDLNDLGFDDVAELMYRLNLKVYTPLEFVHPSRLAKYVDLDSRQGASWQNRETGRNQLMMSNLLKRLESSIHSFRITSQNILVLINNALKQIENYEKGIDQRYQIEEFGGDDFDAEELGEETVGKELRISIADMDYTQWRERLLEDKAIFQDMLTRTAGIEGMHDLKLAELKREIREKIHNPINDHNKKVVIFTAFANTADYLYDEIKDWAKREFGLNSAVVTGSSNPRTTLSGIRADFNDVLTCFSPISKNRDLVMSANAGDIDILIATDCISEGQNLQDCDYLINYDIHWNPVRIIQRFGRVDRLQSKNDYIQLVNFWPNITLDQYIQLKGRVEGRMIMVDMTATGSDNPLSDEERIELEYRKKQLQKIQDEVVDLEDMDAGVSIMDLGLNEFHLDLQSLLEKYGEASNTPHGIHAVAEAGEDSEKGVIFVLKNINSGVNIKNQNRIHPFYAVFITEDGEVRINHLQVKELLNQIRLLAKNKDSVQTEPARAFNQETNDGKNMEKYTHLLTLAIQSMMNVEEKSDLDSLFSVGETTFGQNEIHGLDDFELIAFLVVC